MAQGSFKDMLKSRGFVSYLWTLFLGALNDNAYKILVSMLAADMATGDAGSGTGGLAAILAVFIVPFVLFSGYAAHFSDVFNKRKVLIVVKCFEILAMGLAIVAFAVNSFPMMLVVMFLMATQSAFFSPAKYGIIPEMWGDKDLSRANGLVEMATLLAIVLGTSIGSFLGEIWKDRDQLWLAGVVMTGIAVVGVVTSLGITRVPDSGCRRPFSWNPWGEIMRGLARLWGDRPLWLTTLGIAYFWFLGAVFQVNILVFGKNVLMRNDTETGLMLTFMAIGIAIGSVVAGKLSGDKVELGLVPLGSIGIGVFSLLLSFSTSSYWLASTMLVLLGFCSGFFIVPLLSYLQQRAGAEEKGRLLATSGFVNNVGILLSAGLFYLLSDYWKIPADRILLIFGLASIPATIYILYILPDFTIRLVLYLLTHTIYRIRVVGQRHVPFNGPALLICNHMSHIDGLLVSACVQRFVRFMVHKQYYETRGLRWLFKLARAVPTSTDGPQEIRDAIEHAREELRQGHVVCIFAEGGISRTGSLLPFRRGFEKIAAELDVPVIPVHLGQLWGSIFSFTEGKFFWKWPRRIPYPVTVSFGAPLPAGADARQAREAIQVLSGDAVAHRRDKRDLLHSRFIRSAKRHWRRRAMADSSGQDLTFGRTLIAARLLSGWIRRECPGEKKMGLMFPASVGGALANIATLMADKVPVNLNFTTGEEALRSAIEQCEITTILTSKKFKAKAKLPELDGMVFLEEITAQFTGGQKALMAAATWLAPVWLLQARHNRKRQKPSDLATVIFSSGSTGAPKGVMLSHGNILANSEDLAQMAWVTEEDCMLGVLPFFHSFGFTGTLWFPLLAGFSVAYHPNPIDAKTIGKMVEKHQATIMISTPTFYQAYLRKCSAEQFASLRLAVVGAEKLRESLAEKFREKYGKDLLEGYGCTEMGPVVAVNVPDVRHGKIQQKGTKSGTVGHPLPSVAALVVDPNTREPLGYDEEGLLLVRGANRMLGYLGQPEKTAEVFVDGWYVTGDIAKIDSDGFITITDRLSRFSKIGGEMVPHIKVEDAINEILGDPLSAVTGLPCEQKGEKLIVLYTKPDVEPKTIWTELGQSGLPNLFIPRRENIFPIDVIPTLGTGKTDLKGVKTLAQELAGKK